MAIESFKPDWKKEDKYAVAIPVQGGTVAPLASYDNLELLKAGYTKWKAYALKNGITKPLPIQFLDNKGTCKILTELIQETETS